MSEQAVHEDDAQRPRTLGGLRALGYVTRTVREEMRQNLLGVLARRERLLPGIIGFDNTVIPELENALLAGHHIVLLGERGQAKSRVIRGLLRLLDPAIPAVRDGELHEVKSPLILQPGPAALTDGLDQLVRIVGDWERRVSKPAR